MKRIAPFVVPAILMGIIFIGSFIILYIAGTPAQRASPRIAAVLKTIDSNMEFWEVVKSGMQTAATEFSARLEIYGPWMESDVEGQKAIMDTVIKDRPTVIVLSATDFTALIPYVERAAAAGIPVITLDSGIDSDIPVTFVATNSVEAAEKLGHLLPSLLEPGRSVAIINHVPGATTAIEREAGVRKALEKDGRYPILGTWFTNNFLENAYAIALGLCEEYPELGAILAMNEVSTVGAAQALVDAGLAGKVKLLGFDSSLEEIKFIERGVLDATVIQKPFAMGYLAVRAALDAINKIPQARFIDTGSVLITADNLYLPENQKLLFPFAE
jgi:ribose transport system substrate-binding protein